MENGALLEENSVLRLYNGLDEEDQQGGHTAENDEPHIPGRQAAGELEALCVIQIGAGADALGDGGDKAAGGGKVVAAEDRADHGGDQIADAAHGDAYHEDPKINRNGVRHEDEQQQGHGIPGGVDIGRLPGPDLQVDEAPDVGAEDAEEAHDGEHADGGGALIARAHQAGDQLTDDGDGDHPKKTHADADQPGLGRFEQPLHGPGTLVGSGGGLTGLDLLGAQRVVVGGAAHLFRGVFAPEDGDDGKDQYKNRDGGKHGLYAEVPHQEVGDKGKDHGAKRIADGRPAQGQALFAGEPVGLNGVGRGQGVARAQDGAGGDRNSVDGKILRMTVEVNGNGSEEQRTDKDYLSALFHDDMAEDKGKEDGDPAAVGGPGEHGGPVPAAGAAQSAYKDVQAVCVDAAADKIGDHAHEDHAPAPAAETVGFVVLLAGSRCVLFRQDDFLLSISCRWVLSMHPPAVCFAAASLNAG